MPQEGLEDGAAQEGKQIDKSRGRARDLYGKKFLGCGESDGIEPIAFSFPSGIPSYGVCRCPQTIVLQYLS